MSKLRRPPAPPMLPLLWNLFRARRDANPLHLRLFREYGDIVWIRDLHGSTYLVSNPAYIKHFLADQAVNNYPKNPTLPPRSAVMGHSISTIEGAAWLRHRRMLQPAFQRERLLAGVPRMVEGLQRQLDAYWEPHARSGEPMAVHAATSRLVVSTLGPLVFSEDLPDDVCDAVYWYMLNAIEPPPLVSLVGPRFLERAWYDRHHPKALPAARRINAFSWEVVRKRMALSEQPDDMLGLLINARDSAGERLTDREVRDEFVELIYGGQVGTGNGLAWMWHYLANGPELFERLSGEVERVLGGRAPGVSDLKGLAYLMQVFDETLRLHPSSSGLARTAIKEDTLGDYDIPVGTTLATSTYVMHRHPAYWKDPEVFDPERFTPEQVQARPRFVYIPFGAGQRVCIGAMLASLIATLSTALIAQRYRLEPVPGKKVEPLTGGAHYPGNLWLKVLPARPRVPVAPRSLEAAG